MHPFFKSSDPNQHLKPKNAIKFHKPKQNTETNGDKEERGRRMKAGEKQDEEEVLACALLSGEGEIVVA